MTEGSCGHDAEIITVAACEEGHLETTHACLTCGFAFLRGIWAHGPGQLKLACGHDFADCLYCYLAPAPGNKGVVYDYAGRAV